MTTNNHPAHGPVSLDRLHQIRQYIERNNQYQNCGNRAYILADMLKVIDEVLASRNAEPVLPDEKPMPQASKMHAIDAVAAIAEVRGWNAYRAAMLQAGNSPVTPDCWCRTCRPVTMNDMRFVVCPECGNKRCPHANDHRHSCSGSNAPCQEGSAYPVAPQQDVRLALEIGMSRYAGAMQKLVDSGD